MTTKAIQFRRGTTANHTIFTGLSGEITVDTDINTAVIHDEKTLGGIPLARADLQNIELSSLLDKGLTDNTLSNVSNQTILDKGIAKSDLSNVDKEAFLSKDLLKTDLSNISIDAKASVNKAGLVQLANLTDALLGTDNTKALTPYIFKSSLLAQMKLPQLHMQGLLISNTLTNKTKEIDISTGCARDKDNTCNIILTSPISKKLNVSFEAGTGSGGLASNLTLQNSQVYYVFILYNAETGLVDAGFDIDLSAQNLINNPYGFTKYRRIGLIKTDATGNILEMEYIETAGGGVKVLCQRILSYLYTGATKSIVVDFGFGNQISPIIYTEQNNLNLELKYAPINATTLISKSSGFTGVILSGWKVDQTGSWDIKIVPYTTGNATLGLYLGGFTDERIS